MKEMWNNIGRAKYKKRLRRIITAAASLALAGAMVTVYYFMPVMGAAVDVLKGSGSMDDAAQIGAWTLTNVNGTSSWNLDTSGYYTAPGSGRLESPAGSGVPYEAYVSYSFTTDKQPVSASLNLAYSKQFSIAQPPAGGWDVQAEIWQVGGTAPLQVIPIDSGNANVGWTNLANINVTSVNQINTQYELRLVEKGTTGADPSAFSTTWFDNVQLNVDYDSTPPQPVSASAQDDHTVDIVFDETVEQASAQTVSNYSISPGLTVSGAALQPDGRTVRLNTAEAQTFGTSYTVTVSNVADISGNTITAPGTAVFSGVDTTPPAVESAASLTDRTVNVKFNEPVEAATSQNVASYSISPSLGITAAVLQADLQTVRLSTDAQAFGTNYTITVNYVQDAHGNIISSSNTADFTGLDSTPPAVVSAAPVTDTTVNVVFSEPVDLATAQNPNSYNVSPAMVVTGAALQADQKTVLLTTSSSQTKDTSYTVTVTGVNDLHGNTVNGVNTASFTGIDTTPPQLASAVSVTDTTVNVIFNEAVDAAAAQTTANYSISPDLAVTGAVLQSDAKTVQLTTDRQNWKTEYTVTASNIPDLAGNLITGNNSAGFTGLDNTPPTVISAAAVNDTTVDVVFSEKVEGSTAQTAANYTISGGLAVANPVLQADGKTVRLTTTKQTAQTGYTITVNGVWDLAGNAIGTNNTAAFNGVDSTPPTVIYASAVNYNTVNVVFSEKVELAAAQAITNYAISPALQVTAAVVQSDGLTVQLTTSAQTGGEQYWIKVSGVQDLDQNVIGKYGNSANFYGITPPTTSYPYVLSAKALDNDTVELKFNATLDPVSATAASNYTISPDLAVTGAILTGDGVTVRLTTATQTQDTAYTVTVSQVQDIYGNIVDSTHNSAAFTGSGVSADNPHGNYLDNTNQCSGCHVTHNAQGPGLTSVPDQTQVCYLCHDAGGQSQYDVADQFGKTPPYANSHHKIPEGTQQCSDCHNPHDGGKDGQGRSVHWPRLLQSSASQATHGGNDFCFSCHKDPLGGTKAVDPATYPEAGVGHNKTDFAINGTTPYNPGSGTGIACSACHEEHGSSLDKLLKVNPTNDTSNVAGDDKSLCYKCHTGASANGRYPGQAVYDNTVNNPHALTTSTKTNVDYPGATGQAGQCAACHDPHGSANGTGQVSMKTLRGVYNDGKTSYSAGDFGLCFGCHNSTSKNGRYDVQTPYSDINGGHYIKTAGGNLAVGSKMPCEACHTLHGSNNNNKYMLKDSLGSNLGDGRNECMACHEAGKQVEGLTMTALPADVPEHTGGTTACLTCHDSSHAPTPGVSSGGQDCSVCHSPTAVALSSTSSGYHHLINNTSATYSTTQSGSLNCLSCHVDHNKFNNQKAFNLKANYSESFPAGDTTPGQNTDFNSADTTYGGICLSCHQNRQNKSYAQANGSLATPPISISGFTGSAHNYNVFSLFGDSTVFNANCVKCHNDNMSKTKQSSSNQFGTHNSSYQGILSNFTDFTLTDPLKQQFCLKCHSASGDYYGTAMSETAKQVAAEFGKASKHDITGMTGAQLSCVNCHGPHTVSKNPLSAGLNNSDISDPTNTLIPFIKASGDMSAFCLKCHDGSPPGAVNNGSAFVPYSVIFPDLKFTGTTGGWNKSSYTRSGHYAAGFQCDKCHGNHGADYTRLTLLPEDGSGTPSAASGICLQCHGNQSGRPAGAADVYTDLTSGSDFTYRHPTLNDTGRHSDTETYPQATADRNASCYDCHEPHAANRTTATDGNASGKIAGTTGVTPAYPTNNSPFAAPSSYGFGSTGKEYQLCFKCHTGFNGSFPSPPAGAIAETDLAKEFNPANPSFHDVGLYTGAARDYVGSFQAGTGMTGSTVLYCSSCHGSDAGSATLQATSGPVHGSTNRYILKGGWDSSLSLGASTPANNLCLKCHDVKSNSSRFTGGTQNLHALGAHGGASCQSCHSEVPHGGKRPSLITVKPSSPITGPYQYDSSYDGVYGKNSKLELRAWKSGGTYWNKSDCGGCHSS